MIHMQRPVTLVGHKSTSMDSHPCFVQWAAPPHGEWPSVHLIQNNSITVEDTMLGIFVKVL